MPDSGSAFRLWTSASAVPFFLLVAFFLLQLPPLLLLLSLSLYLLLAAFCLLLGSACCCWLLPAAAFCLLLLGSACCWVSRWEKGCMLLLDLDRTSIEFRSDPACLCRNPVLKLAIPLLAVSATRYLFALPIGSVSLHQASSCLLPTIWGTEFGSVHKGKTMFHIHENLPDVSATEYGLM